MRWPAVAALAFGISAGGLLLWYADRSPTSPNRAAVSAPLDDARIPDPPPPRRHPAASAGKVEMCGYGSYQPTYEHPYPAEVEATAQGAMERAATALSESALASERALGLFTRAGIVASKVLAVHEGQQKGCANDPACVDRAHAAAERAAEPVVEELARFAGGSRDPRAYALALYRCGSFSTRRPPAGACALLSARTWAQLEPENLVPWVYVIQEAESRKDTQERDQALYRASQARYANLHWDAVFPLAESPALTELDPAARLVAYAGVMGVYAAFPAPHYGPALKFCTTEPAAEAGGRDACDRLATLLVERSGTLLDFSTGIVLGERLGWPAERLLALREEKDALQYVSVNSVRFDDIHSCDALQLLKARMQSFGRHGELESARRAIVASGKSTAQLAQHMRTDRAKPGEGAQRSSTEGRK